MRGKKQKKHRTGGYLFRICKLLFTQIQLIVTILKKHLPKRFALVGAFFYGMKILRSLSVCLWCVCISAEWLVFAPLANRAFSVLVSQWECGNIPRHHSRAFVLYDAFHSVVYRIPRGGSV